MWLLLREPGNCFAVVPASDVECIATRRGQPFLRVGFRSHCREAFTNVLTIDYFDSMEAAIDGMIDMDAIRACRVCGCTDDDCSQCVEKTGQPCSWVEDDLCSACHVEPPVKALADDCPKCKTPWALCPCTSTPDQQRGTDAASVAILGDPREPDGFPLATGDGMRDLARIDAHMKEQTGIADAEKGDLSPLQDGNHPQLEAHRQRMGEASGDPMASAKALLARKHD